MIASPLEVIGAVSLRISRGGLRYKLEIDLVNYL